MKNILIKALPPKQYLELKRLHCRVTKPGEFSRLQEKREDVTNSSYSCRPFVESKSIFIHVPKCAGSSISRSLYGNLAGGHIPIDGYTTIFKPEEILSYFKFAFVRNPWDRLVSAYHFLKDGGLTSRDAKWARQELGDFDSFDKFVHNWLNEENIWKYYHFQPQSYYICNHHDKLNLNFIGFFENIDEDFDYVTNKLNKRCDLKKINTSSQKNYQDYYDDITEQIVADVYAEDIEMLGYDFANSNIKNQLKMRSHKLEYNRL
ncbi:sulfotransferase family 2 domain-containing protein [cf. Phormidesmis sp. LEGE 11477]|uniref:sulfotransferase family 2 domain-containing protein n=1 Tax=cf. Phormidesmis sp. LEGE 11477 TaxID=1828680 RepID=UPI00187E4E0B|nr:sulfotransferase family 2 domain-containing protein [cf. Phormidesmis sp. LEGE 11477]MBE9061363.1 sulfotransferase family 2 domain-containing protein [cf. Phormidesmis sp. LEGE 11477]